MKKLIFLVLVLFMVLSGCNSGTPGTTSSPAGLSTTPGPLGPGNDPDRSYDIYVAGSDGPNCCYWINDQKVVLGPNGLTWSILVSNQDVYAVGYINWGATWRCWKNGTVIYENNRSENWRSVFVSGNDVYIFGYDGDSSCYWKNGVRVSLPFQAIPFGDRWGFVSGANVYAVGGIGGAPYYTVNDVIVNLPIPQNAHGNSSSIYVDDNGDVYVSGGYNAGVDACYWKNGVRVDLPKTMNCAYADSIFVSNGDVYVAGKISDSTDGDIGTCIPCYWKNGVLYTLPSLSNQTHLKATSIFGINNDVFAVGSTDRGAAYWKNGVITDLNGWCAHSIYVVED